MRIADFALERYFARWEFAVEHVLCASDVEGWPMAELLELARLDRDSSLDLTETDLSALVADAVEDAVHGADVVCCCTHAAEPILRREWLSPGTHVTSVGAALDGPELDPATVGAGLLCVESRVAFQPPPAGSFELQGLDPAKAVELGEVLAGTREGRTSDEQLTVYKSMGHAVEDAAAAALVLERASAS